ncbi:MAG: hypothetical protein ACFFAN_00810, partial [Promethearchaeota archaeon]
ELLAKVVQDLWILTKAGIVVFSRVFDEKVDEQLFGALMMALHTFAQNISQGGLSSFDISSKRFTILKDYYKDEEFLFVANSSNKVKDRKIQEELKKISNRFFEKYSNILENWDQSEIDLFYDFEKEIEDSLENPIKKFWDGLVT